MKKSKGSLRSLHIGDEIWKYIIDKKDGRWDIELRIYDPIKNMTRVSTETFMKFLSDKKLSNSQIFTPSNVKEYIEWNVKLG